MASESRSINKKKGWENITTDFPVDIKASVESGQPLTFHSVYNIYDNMRRVSYVTPKGVIQLEYPKNSPTSRSGTNIMATTHKSLHVRKSQGDSGLATTCAQYTRT